MGSYGWYIRIATTRMTLQIINIVLYDLYNILSNFVWFLHIILLTKISCLCLVWTSFFYFYYYRYKFLL